MDKKEEMLQWMQKQEQQYSKDKTTREYMFKVVFGLTQRKLEHHDWDWLKTYLREQISEMEGSMRLGPVLLKQAYKQILQKMLSLELKEKKEQKRRDT